MTKSQAKRITAQKAFYVWCAEDEKYGLLEVFATKAAAEKEYGARAKVDRWRSGYGGSIIKRIVRQG